MYDRRENLVTHIREQHGSTIDRQYICPKCFKSGNSEYKFQQQKNFTQLPYLLHKKVPAKPSPNKNTSKGTNSSQNTVYCRLCKMINDLTDDDNFMKSSNIVENENNEHKAKPNEKVPNLRPILPKPAPLSKPSTSKRINSSQNNDAKSTTAYTGYCGLCKIAYPINQSSTLVDHFKSNQHQTNLKAKHLKNVLATQQDEDLREATALDISNINFDYEETIVMKEEEMEFVVKKEETMDIKEEEKFPTSYLSEAGPSNLNSDTTKNTPAPTLPVSEDDDNFTKKSNITENEKEGPNQEIKNIEETEIVLEKNTKEYENEQTVVIDLSDDNESENQKTEKRLRFVFTANQIKQLQEYYYKTSKYITQKEKLKMSETLNIPQKQIKLWFQNRRQNENSKQLKNVYESANIDSTTATVETGQNVAKNVKNIPNADKPISAQEFKNGLCKIGLGKLLAFTENFTFPQASSSSSNDTGVKTLPVTQNVVIDLSDDDDVNFTKKSDIAENEEDGPNKKISIIKALITAETKILPEKDTKKYENQQIVTSSNEIQKDEILREATALDTSNINFDYEDTIVIQEEVKVEIKEETPPKSYLPEAGPSNLNSYMTTENTQSQDLFKCYICDKNFNQFDLEIHFVTDHNSEELL